MKTMRKTLLTSLLPIIAFTATSCNGAGQKVSFNKAIEYASAHFDAHALDAVKSKGTLKLNSLTINGKGDLTDVTTGTKQDYVIASGVKGFNLAVDEVPALSINSTIINAISSYYTSFSSVLATMAGNNPFDLNFYLKNGGEAIELVTNNFGANMIDFIMFANSASNADSYALAKILQIPNKNIQGLIYSPDYNKWEDYLTGVVTSIIGEAAASIVIGMGFLDIGMPGDIVKKLCGRDQNESEHYDGLYDNYFVGIEDSSKSYHDKFNCKISTNTHGFLTSLSLVFKVDLSILANLTPKQGKEGDAYVAKGNLSFDFDITYNATIK